MTFIRATSLNLRINYWGYFFLHWYHAQYPRVGFSGSTTVSEDPERSRPNGYPKYVWRFTRLCVGTNAYDPTKSSTPTERSPRRSHTIPYIIRIYTCFYLASVSRVYHIHIKETTETQTVLFESAACSSGGGGRESRMKWPRYRVLHRRRRSFTRQYAYAGTDCVRKYTPHAYT